MVCVKEISSYELSLYRDLIQKTGSLIGAMQMLRGAYTLADGLWRIFTGEYPKGGGEHWNTSCSWKNGWNIPVGVTAFAEDIFGNQLLVSPDSPAVRFWDHESGDMIDLHVEPIELLETVLSNGISWIDSYPDNALDVALKRMSDVPETCHLHWITPLILGGEVQEKNTGMVERDSHLVGHAELWRQVSFFPPGTTIMAKP